MSSAALKVLLAGGFALGLRKTVRVACETTTGGDPSDVSKCAAILDTEGKWNTEYTNFGKGATVSGGPLLHITRFSQNYVDDKGNKSPFMRMVCFLPGVTPDAVCLCMCEPSARLQWDENYRHFEKFTDDDAVTDVKQRTRPIRDVCGKTAVCVGDRCLLSPVIGENRTESAWFSHRVSTGFAASLGQPDRLFFYLRRTFTYLFQDNGDAFHPMIDVLYDGSSSMFEHANAKSGAFQMWAAKTREKTFHSAWMNYQHACFVPITNFEQQITPETVTEISTTGSMFDVKSSKSFYKLFSESRELQRVGNGGVSGTLLVMTSANDIGIPPFLPRWSQKKIMVYVATRDFDHLMQLLQSPPQ